VFILDLETVRDAIGTIKQIRESAPTSKIVLLCGLEDKDRTREAFAYGVDGIVLNIQPPGVMLATIEALYALAPHRLQAEHNGTVWVDVAEHIQAEGRFRKTAPGMARGFDRARDYPIGGARTVQQRHRLPIVD
jgi:DNA-binding NarL/FixJ family response regulator